MDVNRLLAALPWVEELPENPYENLTQAAGPKMSFSWQMEGEREGAGVKVGITLFLTQKGACQHTSSSPDILCMWSLANLHKLHDTKA